MIAIILAAGLGKRLMPLTKDIPKTLIKIENKSILERIIEKCISNHIEDFIIVTGYRKEKVSNECKYLQKKYNINLFEVVNDQYSRTNTAYSLQIALKNLINSDCFLIINGDNIFDTQIITNLLKSKKTALVIDNIKKLNAESFKIEIDNNIILNMGKTIDIEKSSGEFIGISKVVESDYSIFMSELNKLIYDNVQQYYDIAFKVLSHLRPIDFVYTNNLKWTEIDTLEDLDYAKNIIYQLRD